MNIHNMDPTLDRLFRHMAWANVCLFEQLARVPVGSLALKAPNNDSSVASIAEHFVRSAGFYVTRLGGSIAPFDYVTPESSGDIVALAGVCAGFDGELRAQAVQPDGIAEYVRDGKTIRRARSTILGQSIHHATEHRAQIAGILSLHGVDDVDLDAIDLWGFGDAEGLGE
ncbi:MAG TPA: DinB family protein [Candidatus Nanopelagicaceae bacterium]